VEGSGAKNKINGPILLIASILVIIYMSVMRYIWLLESPSNMWLFLLEAFGPPFLLAIVLRVIFRIKEKNVSVFLIIPLIIPLMFVFLYCATERPPSVPPQGAKYFRCTFLSEPVLNKQLTLKIEFELLKDIKNAQLYFDFPEVFQIAPFPEKDTFFSTPWCILLGDLMKDHKYEYQYKLRITKTGYWRSSCRIDSNPILIDLGQVMYIEVTPEGGRIEDYDFRKKLEGSDLDYRIHLRE
jgi:hypothetical protein